MFMIFYYQLLQLLLSADLTFDWKSDCNYLKNPMKSRKNEKVWEHWGAKMNLGKLDFFPQHQK